MVVAQTDASLENVVVRPNGAKPLRVDHRGRDGVAVSGCGMALSSVGSQTYARMQNTMVSSDPFAVASSALAEAARLSTRGIFDTFEAVRALSCHAAARDPDDGTSKAEFSWFDAADSANDSSLLDDWETPLSYCLRNLLKLQFAVE